MDSFCDLCTPKRGVSFLRGIVLQGDVRLIDEGFIKFILTNFLLWSERVLPLQPCSEGTGKNKLNKWSCGSVDLHFLVKTRSKFFEVM
jgi:hypothetical protein